MAHAPLVSPEDMNTHIYAEHLTEITRNDGQITETAISSALKEASVYLSRYDRPAILGDMENGIGPSLRDPFLISLIKDIALWHIIRLANPGIEYPHVQAAYQAAIAKLMQIQAGHVTPLWPYVDTTSLSMPDGIFVRAQSNGKRNNGY